MGEAIVRNFSTDQLRVVLVDSLPVIIKGIRGYLDTSPEINVVGTAHSYEEALSTVQETNPDVVLLDPALSEQRGNPCPKIERGLQLMLEIHRYDAHTEIIAMAMNHSPDVMRRVLDAGASGFVSKWDSLENLPAVLLEFGLEGEHSYFSPKALGALADSMSRRGPEARLDAPLTKREKEVLKLVVSGKASKQIAQSLGISVRTVHTHRSRILHKSNASSFFELIDARNLG